MFRAPVRLEEWIALDGGLAVDVAKEASGASDPGDGGDGGDDGSFDRQDGKDADGESGQRDQAAHPDFLRKADAGGFGQDNGSSPTLFAPLEAPMELFAETLGTPLEYLLADLIKTFQQPSGGGEYQGFELGIPFTYDQLDQMGSIDGIPLGSYLAEDLEGINVWSDVDTDVRGLLGFYCGPWVGDGVMFYFRSLEVNTINQFFSNLPDGRLTLVIGFAEDGETIDITIATITISTFIPSNKPGEPALPNPGEPIPENIDPILEPVTPIILDGPIPSWIDHPDREAWALPARFDFVDDWWDDDFDFDSQARAMLPDLPELGDLDGEIHQAVGEAMRFITNLQDAMERFQTHLAGQDADELPDAEAAEAGTLLAEGRRQLELLRNEVGLLVGQAEAFAGLPPEQRDGVVTEDLSTQIETTSRVAGQASAMADAFYAVDRLVAPQAEGLGIGLRELFQRVFGASERKAEEAQARRDPLNRALEDYRLKER